MRKIIVLEHITLDGVIQAPGGPEEDTEGWFEYGGWAAPYFNEQLGEALGKQINLPFDLLLGRRTFEIWEEYWPKHSDMWPGSMTATKYVASNTITSSEWKPSIFLNGDVAKKIAEIKKEEGPDLHVWGSSNLIQTLMKHDLVDTFWLLIFPITLGTGKKLFAEGTIPAAFKVTESTVAPNGVIVVNYERAGEVTTGTMGG